MKRNMILELLKLNLIVDNYRALVFVPSRFNVEQYVQELCKDNETRYITNELTIKNKRSNASIRFFTNNDRLERVRGLTIHHAIVDDFVLSEQMSDELKSRLVRTNGKIIHKEN